MEEQNIGLAAFSLRCIEKTNGFYASRRRWIGKDKGWEVSRRRWIDKNSGLEASRKRWIEKTSGLEASRTLRDDLEGLKHYACAVFCGPGDATEPSNLARESYPGPPEPYNFYVITNNLMGLGLLDRLY